MQDELFLALEGAAQAAGHRELGERVVALDRVDEVAVAAVVLRLVHRRVGVLEQGLGVRRVERVEADADGRAHEDLDVGDDEGLTQRAADPAGDGLGGVAGAFEVELAVGASGSGDEEEELVAAVARDDLFRAGRTAQACRDRCEKLVAGLVAEAVVDELEVVEVDEEDGERRRSGECGLRGAPGRQPGSEARSGDRDRRCAAAGAARRRGPRWRACAP